MLFYHYFNLLQFVISNNIAAMSNLKGSREKLTDYYNVDKDDLEIEVLREIFRVPIVFQHYNEV